MTESSIGAPQLDLTPREPKKGRRGSPARRWMAAGLAVVLLVSFGFLSLKMLTEASVFFRNADEAVALRDSLGDDRFRLQGTVVAGTVVNVGTGIRFEVVYNGVTVDVEHTGVPPELFSEDIPVVLEGYWDGDLYRSDEIFVKHDEVYVDENGERIDEAELRGTAP